MLLVLSSMNDPHVAPALARWKAAGVEAHALTCHDLAQPGWRLTLTDNPTLVVGGDKVPAAQIRGVITRLSWVTSHELPFMAAADRDYAAAEMHAFLLALLTRLARTGHKVINQPTPGCLSGPSWSQERWVAAAAEAGVDVHPITYKAFAGGYATSSAPAPVRRSVSVVGDQVFGDAPESIHLAARAIAAIAGTELLRVGFVAKSTRPVFMDADSWIDLGDPQIADAVARRFR